MPKHPSSIYSANGIRTRVWALRGPRPSPLDDSAAHQRPDRARAKNSNQFPQARRESNPQPPVLETGALPIELRTFSRTATSCELRNTTNCGQLGSVRHSEFVLQGWLTGIEPATPGATDRCSNQLSYSHHEPLCILTALDNRINGAFSFEQNRARSVGGDPATRVRSLGRSP